MKRISSPGDFDSMLQAERAVVFIFFDWSAPSAKSRQVVDDWQRQAARPEYQVFELMPDGYPFTWKWLDTFLYEEEGEERTRGAIVWLRSGEPLCFTPDAARSGIGSLESITTNCFGLGKTPLGEAIAALECKRAAIDTELLKILCCPETHQSLAFADATMLDKVNQRLNSSELRNRAGQPVQEKIEAGLVRADGRYLYPMRRNIPVLLVDEAIPL